MKTGVIVYATGEPPAEWTEKVEEAVKRRLPQADAVEIITRNTGHFDVADAWLSLTTKGMLRILCRMAHFSDTGKLHLTDATMRLCG